MKKQLTILALVSVCGYADLHAQSGYSRMNYRMLDEARAQLDAGQWADAQRIYKRLLNVDTTFADVYYEIGLCELNMPDIADRAAEHFASAVKNGSREGIYQLALVRHHQQLFDEEIALLKTYKDLGQRAMPNAEVDRQADMARTAKAMTEKPVHVIIRNMGDAINSSAHDYCPLVTADGKTIYFTSRRAGSMGGLKDESGQWLEDIYFSNSDDDIWSHATNANAPLCTSGQDATVGLSPDGNEMIIYRAGQGMMEGDLFLTDRMQGVWQTPKRMTSQINSGAHEPSATISPDGSEIYFTSDRAGGFGGRDLYRIRRLPNGQWSLPLNLGPNINTAYDEDAPFIHSDGTTLFFSSNGHHTMGGFDIFKADLIDPDMGRWGEPVNLGYPLNTVNDDIYFCMGQDGLTGYFSSERDGGLGGQDIYQVVFPVSQINYMLVHGVVIDPGEEPVKARITLTDDKDEEIIGVYNTNQNTGRYIMAVKPGTTYHVTVDAAGFETWKRTLLTDGESALQEMSFDVTLVRDRTARNIAEP